MLLKEKAAFALVLLMALILLRTETAEAAEWDAQPAAGTTIITIDKSTPQLNESGMPDSSMHFAVDNSVYGMSKAIIFRPDLTSLGEIPDGDEFTVAIDGLRTSGGASTSLSYMIRFFSLI